MKNKYLTGICLVILMSALTLNSCNNKKEPLGTTPSGVVSAWSKAVLDKKYEQALRLTAISEEDYPLYEAWMKMMFDELDGVSLDVVSQELSDDGDYATVNVTMTNGKEIDTIQVQTVKIEGLWKVRLRIEN